MKTPVECFKLFIPQSFVDTLVEQSRLYAQQSNQPIKGNKVTSDTMWASIVVTLLTGYNKIPNRQHYWSQKPDLHNKLVSDSIRRDVCEDILSVTHMTDNMAGQNSPDKFYKVCPIFDLINRTSKK